MKTRAKHAPKSLNSSQVSFRVIIVCILVFLIFFVTLYLNHWYLYSHFGTPKSALSASKNAAPDAKVPSTKEPPPDSGKNTTNLTFYDRLTGKETPDSTSPSGSSSSGDSLPSSPSAPRTKPGETIPNASLPNTSGSAEGETAPQDTSFTVQVGSFQTLEGAEKVLALLKQQGFEASVSPVNLSDDRTWYRVRIGKFPVREEAEQVTKKLKESGSFDPLIMPLKRAGQ
jgi:cell division protein FtsN